MKNKYEPDKIRTASAEGDVAYLKKVLTQTDKKVEETVLQIALNNHKWAVLEMLSQSPNKEHLMEVGLSVAVKNDDLLAVEKVLPYITRPTLPLSSLQCAISHKHFKVLQYLLNSRPTVDPHTLMYAVRSQSVEILYMVLPHCDPKAHCSAALQEAVAYQDKEMFDILYPVSNPQVAWDVIRKDDWFDQKQRHMLKSRLDTDRQRAKLERAVNVARPSGKIKKM